MNVNNYVKYDLCFGHIFIHACEVEPHTNVFQVIARELFTDKSSELVLPKTSPFAHFDGKTYIMTPLQGENSMIELNRFNRYYGGEE